MAKPSTFSLPPFMPGLGPIQVQTPKAAAVVIRFSRGEGQDVFIFNPQASVSARNSDDAFGRDQQRAIRQEGKSIHILTAGPQANGGAIEEQAEGSSRLIQAQ